jgi:hypothetical protein
MKGLSVSSDRSVQSENEELEKISDSVPEDFLDDNHLYRKKIVNPTTKRIKSHIFIKNQTNIPKCVAYCIDLMYNKQFPYVKLTAISKNMDKAVIIAEQLKRKVKNLHQINELETFHYYEVFTPKEPREQSHQFKIQKYSTTLSIKITRVAPGDKNHYGYQNPLQINLVSSRDPRDYIKRVLEMAREPKKKQLMSHARKNLEKMHDKKNYNNNYNNNNSNIDRFKKNQNNKFGQNMRNNSFEKKADQYNEKRNKSQHQHQKAYKNNNPGFKKNKPEQYQKIQKVPEESEYVKKEDNYKNSKNENNYNNYSYKGPQTYDFVKKEKKDTIHYENKKKQYKKDNYQKKNEQEQKYVYKKKREDNSPELYVKKQEHSE